MIEVLQLRMLSQKSTNNLRPRWVVLFCLFSLVSREDFCLCVLCINNLFYNFSLFLMAKFNKGYKLLKFYRNRFGAKGKGRDTQK